MHGNSLPSAYVSQGVISVVVGVYLAHWWVFNVVCSPSLFGVLLFNGTFVLALWSYLRTCYTDPGTPRSEEWKGWEATRSEDNISQTKQEYHSDLNALGLHGFRRRQYKPGRASWCQNCFRERPERAHHCSQCSVCVLRMDHHCPWVGTCIGWRNHKFFVLLNWWSFVLSFVFLIMLRSPTYREGINVLIDSESGQINVVPLIFIVSAMVFCLVTGGMCIFAIVMGARNVTSIEEMYSGSNPYSYKSRLENFEQLFGPIDCRLFFPVQPYTERLSGTSFPLVGVSMVEEQDGGVEAGSSRAQYGSMSA